MEDIKFYTTGYFIEIEKNLAAAKLNAHFLESDYSDDVDETISHLERAAKDIEEFIDFLREE